MDAEVAIIVPTLGSRGEFLLQCLSSIRAAGRSHTVLVAPASYNPSSLIVKGLVDQVVVDPGGGPAAAINEAVRQLPPTIRYLSWLGDDDCLASNALEVAVGALRQHNADFVWGACRYVDRHGNPIGVNRSGTWAKTLMKVGPDLVPQPGSMFTRTIFEAVGGLDEQYRLAFDYDLFMRFAISGKCIYVSHILADYRWHPDTLSAGSRTASVQEARAVRRSYLPKWLRPISPIWDYPISLATFLAGHFVSATTRSRASVQSTGDAVT